MEGVRDDGRDGKCADCDEEPSPQLVQVLGQRCLLAMSKAAGQPTHGEARSSRAWSGATRTRPSRPTRVASTAPAKREP